MSKLPSGCAVARQTAAHSDVHAMLAVLVERIAHPLRHNFVGAYAQGSLAIGGFNPASDVDVVIVINEDLRAAEIDTYQALHRSLFAELPRPWGQRLELSYQPASILRRWSKVPRDPLDFPRTADWRDPATRSPPKAYPYWYLDNGSQRLVRSEHDNTQVVRWTLRERGLILSGPAPRTLIDPVSRNGLAVEIHEMLGLVARDWATPKAIDEAWLQAFFVTLCCRALYTLETGVVASKQASTEWAANRLDERWRSIIEEALAQYSAPETSKKPLDSFAVLQTIELIHFAFQRAVETIEEGRERDYFDK